MVIEREWFPRSQSMCGFNRFCDDYAAHSEQIAFYCNVFCTEKGIGHMLIKQFVNHPYFQVTLIHRKIANERLCSQSTVSFHLSQRGHLPSHRQQYKQVLHVPTTLGSEQMLRGWRCSEDGDATATVPVPLPPQQCSDPALPLSVLSLDLPVGPHCSGRTTELSLSTEWSCSCNSITQLCHSCSWFRKKSRETPLPFWTNHGAAC